MPISISFGDDNVATLSEARSDVILTPLDDQGELMVGINFVFQYFPDEITDSKSVALNTKEIPGGSLPLYQYIGAGERTISFGTVFTSDVDHISQAASSSWSLGSLLSSSETAHDSYKRVKEAGLERRNVDGRAAITFLRSFLLPRYSSQSDGVAITKPPPRLRLFIPGSGIGITGGVSEAGHGPDAIFCVMSQCEVTYVKFYPSGFPRIIRVQLTFAQIPQVGSVIRFPNSPWDTQSSSILLGSGMFTSSETYLPYTLQPRKRSGQ